ncbi:Protein ANTI-SILENCING 1 [Glycine max]|nr:Protein ANTI-SILENCING 1 [Glycine max]
MSHSRPPPSEANVGKMIDFKWGDKRGVGGKNKDIQYYESFVYEGVQYFLYDCVYLYTAGHVETSIGKLVKIFETRNRQKMIKLVWFFRPFDIRNWLGQYKPCWNELFLASGEGKGVSNFNYLESIIRKCSVICTSKDKRNPKPSEIELKKADYFFNCTFDVVRGVIIDQFTNEIDGIRVERFFNRNGDEKTSNHLHVGTDIRPKIVIKTRTNPCTISHCQVNDKAKVRTYENVLPKQSSDSYTYKKRKIVEEKPTIGQISKTPKEQEIDEKKAELRQDERVKTNKKVIDVIERPDAPWDERLQTAQKMGTLVLLNNLDPSYTSFEVEDLVWCALKARVEARMIEWSPGSSKYYGRALVIFKTKDAAESAIYQLNKRCLVLGEGRIVSAIKGTLREPGKKKRFTGHLVLDRAAHQRQHQEMYQHHIAPNPIQLSTGWPLNGYCIMRSPMHAGMHYMRWSMKQMKEIQDVRSKLKMDRIFSVESLSNPT